MPKRTFWTTVGYGAGMASSWYVQRRVKRVVQRVAPREAVAERSTAIVGRVRSVGDNVVGAVREGRTAMRETEHELRSQHRLARRRRVR